MYLKEVSDERTWAHYGLNFVLANDDATVTAMIVLMEKRNRMAKQDKKIHITPMWRKILKRELAQRMKIRRQRLEQRRQHIYK